MQNRITRRERKARRANRRGLIQDLVRSGILCSPRDDGDGERLADMLLRHRHEREASHV